jgi:glycosyltransferase involved in cell wall biosynthesis
MSRHILFCSDFPFGYHNPEAETKLAGFVARGYGGTYVEKLGIRNPGLRHARELARRLRSRRPAAGAGGPGSPDGPIPFDVISPRLLVPRRAPLVDTVNRRWLARQLLAHGPAPSGTVLWLRYPTPELVPLAARGDWAAVVYEIVDDHEQSPGATPRVVRAMRAAEARILRRADLVFAWSEPLAERLAALHPRVVLAPAAADLGAFAAARAAVPAPRVAAYAGSLDFRFDAELMAGVARALPDWRLRLAGPAEPELAERLGALPNVELLGRVAPAAVPELLAAATACLMPYRRTPFNDQLFPIKLVECLASGRPTVSTGIRAARGFAGDVAIADGVDAFAAAVRAANEDTPEAAARRIARAEPYGWEHRIDEMQRELEAVLR